jgi:hypothetical protein
MVLLLHLQFILFVLFGGLLALRWSRLLWLHLPAVAWGVWIAWRGDICPLTPLENHWRMLAGEAGYSGGFLDHYLTLLIYPPGLTRDIQLLLVGVVLGLNMLIYGVLAWCYCKHSA